MDLNWTNVWMLPTGIFFIQINEQANALKVFEQKLNEAMAANLQYSDKVMWA